MFFRRRNNNPEPENAHEDDPLADIPPDATILEDKTEVTSTPGHSGMHFRRRRIIYEDSTGGIHEIFFKENVLLSGCGHNLLKAEDVGFVSVTSKLPICRTCEKQYNRMRAMTRHEDCKCWHLVAPHELTREEGVGYLCPECLKEHKRFTVKKATVAILKALRLIEEKPPMENPYESYPFPPSTGQYPPPVSGPQIPWSGLNSTHRPYYEMPGSTFEQPHARRLPQRRS